MEAEGRVKQGRNLWVIEKPETKPENSSCRVLEHRGKELSSLEVSVGFDIHHRYISIETSSFTGGQIGKWLFWQREVPQLPKEC